MIVQSVVEPMDRFTALIWISAQVTILYEHTEALIRLQDLLKLPTATDNRVRIVVKQLDFNNKEKNMCVIFWQKP